MCAQLKKFTLVKTGGACYNIAMKELLQEFSDCDTFSLTGMIEYDERMLQYNMPDKTVFLRYLGRNMPYGEAEAAFERALADVRAALGRFFGGVSFAEWEARERVKDGNRRNVSSYYPDFGALGIGEGDFERAAYNFLFWEDQAPVLLARAKRPLVPKADLWGIYAPLLPHCLKVEYVDRWSLTEQPYSGHRHYTFALNDETAAWLVAHEADISPDSVLEDLCFYRNGKLRYASVTHEGSEERFPAEEGA